MQTKWVVLLYFLVFVQSQEMLISGKFLQNYLGNRTLEQASGLVGYDPLSDRFTSSFGGGAKSSEKSVIEVLASTPMGVFGAGNFYFVGPGLEFSSAILQYDSATNQYQGLNKGIWQNNSAAVQQIAYVDNYVVFGGVFSQVVSVAFEETLAGKAAPRFPNIVKMDQNNNFTMLEDPNNVFQCKEQVTALKTSNDGSTLFIYCDLQYLYKWDAQNYFQLLTEDQSLAAIAVDSQNNLFAGAYYTVLIDKVPNCLYTFFNASNNYAASTFSQVCSCSSHPDPDTLLNPWNGGMLVSGNPNCRDTNFYFFNSSTGIVEATLIPTLNAIDLTLTPGTNNDFWVYTISQLYFYSAAYNEWSLVSLAPYTGYDVVAAVYDASNDYLLVYIYLPEVNYGVLGQVSTTTYPPNGLTALISNPNELAALGAVYTIATQPQQNSTSDIYVGGVFDLVGNGVEISNNIAKYSNGQWHPVGTNTQTLQVFSLALSGPNLFYVVNNITSNLNYALPIGGINTETNESILTNIPIVKTPNGEVNSVHAVGSVIYFGGSFVAQLANGTLVNNVVAYDSTKQTWFGLGIPYQKGSEVRSITSNIVNSTNYLCIAGRFHFEIGGVDYDSLALYNVDTESWYPFSMMFYDYGTHINVALFNDTGSIYLGGSVFVDYYNSYDYAGVAFTNIYSQFPSLSPVGNFVPALDALQLAFYTRPNSEEVLFATGFGLAPDMSSNCYYNILGSSNWTAAGEGNALFFSGNAASNIIYLTGGKGLNGINQ